MRPRPAPIASTVLAFLAIGCNTESPYNTLAETPPGGDPPILRPAKASRGKPRAPKPPLGQSLRKVEAVGAKPIAK